MTTRRFTAVIFGIASLASPQQDPTKEPTLPDRTTPILENMNARQRAHAKLFEKYKGETRLLDAGVSTSIDVMPFLTREDGPAPTWADEEEALRRFACTSDAAFEGTVLSSEALPIPNGTFLFTEYLLTVRQVFRQPPRRTVEPNEALILVRFGGQGVFYGTTIVASHNSYPPLRIGHTYLIFATYLSATQSFHSQSSSGLLLVENDRLRNVGMIESAASKAAPAFAFETLRQITCK